MSVYETQLSRLPAKVREEIRFQKELFLPLNGSRDLRQASDVCSRALILHAISYAATIGEREKVKSWLESEDLWEHASPTERTFLTTNRPSEKESIILTWRVEALLVLLWALGIVKDLGAPEREVEARAFERMLPRIGKPTRMFIATAALQDSEEIWALLSIVYQIRSAVNQYILNRSGSKVRDLPLVVVRKPPEGYENIPGGIDPYVAREWHYALNWLTLYGGPSGQDWDDVSTDT